MKRLLIALLLVSNFATAATDWLSSETDTGTQFFLFKSPQIIARYDFEADTYLDPIELSDVPGAFAINDKYIVVAYENAVYRLDKDGQNETHLGNTADSVNGLFIMNSTVFAAHSDGITSLNIETGETIETHESHYSMAGFTFNTSSMRAYARSLRVSPSDIRYIDFTESGSFGAEEDSPYHGDYPHSEQTFQIYSGDYITDTSGVVYDHDLNYVASVRSIDATVDVDDSLVVAKEDNLFLYNSEIKEQGQLSTTNYTETLAYYNGQIFSFYEDKSGLPGIETYTLDDFNQQAELDPIWPDNIKYTANQVINGVDGNVYLLSYTYKSVFIWSAKTREYIDSIPLANTPKYMAYSQQNNTLYFAYSDGRLTYINLEGPHNEIFLANSPQTPCGLSAADPYIFVCDPSGAWVSFFTYDLQGNLIDQKDWSYHSDHYVWSPSTRRMYYLRDDTSPNDLLFTEIASDGTISEEVDSPYHDSNGFLHPIRINPEGTIVLLGSGNIYDADSLEHIDNLAGKQNWIDAQWADGALGTIRGFSTYTIFEEWTKSYGVGLEKKFEGKPVALSTYEDKFIVITHKGGDTHFHFANLPDADNDDVPDEQDPFPNDPTEWADSDSDGIGDNADTDDDNDGVTDDQDAFPLDNTESLDTDNDHIGNNADPDDDNDGVIDSEDAFPLDKNETTDTDQDGLGDNSDPDRDNDGTFNFEDAFPLDPNETLDSDNDGIGNNGDSDDDNDGVIDSEDDFPLDFRETLDSDGDGKGNNNDTDDDDDGILDSNDAFPLDASESIDTDGDGLGNNADNDDDNDGVIDIEDAFPLDPDQSDEPDTAAADDNGSGGGGGALPPLLLVLIGFQLFRRKYI